ncbi:efflux RND transporter periplasmic adaptor subunit [Salinarimonas ramus]|uniref:Secretion protein HlyD n=1 Tax=Salinarimonas ramus TaxID=690164 RepID=A0A917Q4U2_9HYPH|nr:HlyD family efflux transporter periplasmic adaptor subunit [Salinarimonas ramus]GGK24556.1 secretion protein HlyD [Salinarimonas ramus]
MKRVILAILVLAVAAAAFWALRPQPIPADLATIAAGPLAVTVEDEGMTRIEEVYTVSAPMGGTLQRSPRHVGDVVVAGETILAVIEPMAPGFLDIRSQRVAEAAVEAAASAVALAEAQVSQAAAELEFAQSDLARAQELARRETISTRDLDRARLTVRTAESALASAEATRDVRVRELESARANLIQPGSEAGPSPTCCVQVRSPVDGQVLDVVVESEQVVQAGAPLVEVGDPDRLEIVVDLLSRDAVRVEPGDGALIDDWGGDAPLAARVVRVEPTAFTEVSALGIEEQRVRVILALLDPAAAQGKLGHRYRVVARIVVWEEDDVVQVPLGALFREGGDWAVFVVEDGTAQVRLVTLGERTMRTAQVLSGLEEGETVILHASDRIEAGAEVVGREG